MVVDQHLKVNVAKIYTTILHSCRITSIRILHVNLNRHLAEWISRFRRMENLTKLDLNGLGITTFTGFVPNTPEEANARHVAYMLQTNTKLEELSLVHLHSETAKLFLHALTQFSGPQTSLRKLSVVRFGSIHDCFLYIGQALDKFPLLESLVIQGMPNDCDATATPHKFCRGN